MRTRDPAIIQVEFLSPSVSASGVAPGPYPVPDTCRILAYFSLDHTRQRVISWQAEYRILMNKIEEMCSDKPVDEEHLYRVGEHLIISPTRPPSGARTARESPRPCTNATPARRSRRSRRTSQPSTHRRLPCKRICSPGAGR
jgi:hypothetical protein